MDHTQGLQSLFRADALPHRNITFAPPPPLSPPPNTKTLIVLVRADHANIVRKATQSHVCAQPGECACMQGCTVPAV